MVIFYCLCSRKHMMINKAIEMIVMTIHYILQKSNTNQQIDNEKIQKNKKLLDKCIKNGYNT